MQYELFYLIGASKETALEKIKSEIEKIIIDNGGEFLEKTTLEKRKLSYAVKHETHGIYIARRFELENGEKLKEITAKINLHTGVLRFIISRASELPELKSKQERLEEATKKELVSKSREEKQNFKKEKLEEKVETKEKKGREADDIDKKLEEILNI